jgi:hypothetical protein
MNEYVITSHDPPMFELVYFLLIFIITITTEVIIIIIITIIIINNEKNIFFPTSFSTLTQLYSNRPPQTAIASNVFKHKTTTTLSKQLFPANNRITLMSLECISAFANNHQLTNQQSLSNLKERYLLLSNLRDIQIFKCLCRLMCDQLKYRPKATTKAMPSYLFTLRSLFYSSVITLSSMADDNCYRFVARIFGELAKNQTLLRRYFALIIIDYIGTLLLIN